MGGLASCNHDCDNIPSAISFTLALSGQTVSPVSPQDVDIYWSKNSFCINSHQKIDWLSLIKAFQNDLCRNETLSLYH